MKLVRFALGLLVPPLGVFLTVGVGPTLLINILLTVLGWLPGSIHAIWVIAKHEEQLNPEGRTY
ncbi:MULTISPECIES: YqaE/Pmp3 family membrane protein [unclassified Nostoc]|uniref:YqaE/Pmp3 family membrane protein n=1 Tax=unclassified Nostoc TaxID=2593658 RepID=UPI000B959A6F|nr:MULTISPECIES: YqaE/Pmp3 family membrane protein [unclassified Nostoc]AVH63293.1 proteolipid membrane potential modulator Pmp3 [Nostoc sp. 'Peltigera membranacea cyanobiont' N6]OYE05736.1 YqaE/Pmp3 family membrane protein [Nostoc sp. 'Peltigera membranacea cyanobiont' 232]